MLVDVYDKELEEKGERMVPAYHKGNLVYGEHITRYESVAELVRGKIVLDIASGSGYGSYIIAGSAKKVFGVDIDGPSVEYARKNYSRKNIEFLVGSGEKIPLDDASVEVVVTFETIEHIPNYQKFLKEVKRVLKPGGTLLVSTPNDLEFPEGNHFHLHEFEHDELRTLLKKHFKNTRFAYQYTWLAAGVMDEADAATEGVTGLDLVNLAPVPKEKAIYFMVICSDSSIDKLKIDKCIALSQHWSARKAQEDDQQLRAYIKHLEKEQQRSQRNFEKADENLKAIYASRGWHLLTKVYRVKSKLTGRG